MWRLIIIFTLLIVGSIALARGLYIRQQLTEQLDTGAMGAVRSWVMWSTTDGRELVTWYRQVTPWLIYGGSSMLIMGTCLALWTKSQETDKKNKKPKTQKKSKKKKK